MKLNYEFLRRRLQRDFVRLVNDISVYHGH